MLTAKIQTNKISQITPSWSFRGHYWMRFAVCLGFVFRCMINFKMSLVKLTAKTLSKEEASSIVDSFSQELQKLPEIEEIILFGSAARGEMTEASDVDLVAIFPSKEFARSGSKLFHKNRKNFWPVDILFVDREYYDSKKNLGGVLFVAREEGKTIFRKSDDSQG